MRKNINKSIATIALTLLASSTFASEMSQSDFSSYYVKANVGAIFFGKFKVLGNIIYFGRSWFYF